MSTTDSGGVESTATTDRTDLDDRDVRALTEYMTVLPDEGDARNAPGLYVVVGQHENGSYLVDTRTDACTCKDFEYRQPEGGCKHRRRVAFATGERAVPAGVDGVDPQLGQHTDTDVRRAATDGGQAVGEPDEDGGDDEFVADAIPDECQCDTLPDGVPCLRCYMDGAEFGEVA